MTRCSTELNEQSSGMVAPLDTGQSFLLDKLLVVPTLLVALLLTSCGITPYRSEFACSLRDDYGKCIGLEGAYDEAVTGVDSGAPKLSKKGKPVNPVDKPFRAATKEAGDTAIHTEPGTDPGTGTTLSVMAHNSDEYGAYRSAIYQQMRSMLTTPTAPLLRPAQTVRTLIISYANREDSSRLYMPRYVFSISKGPQFVMGDYLNRRPEIDPDRSIRVSQESLNPDTSP